MTFLKNEKDWAKFVEFLEQKNAPDHFPCFAYEVVISWGCEESGAAYLYLEDVEKMYKQIVREVYEELNPEK